MLFSRGVNSLLICNIAQATLVLLLLPYYLTNVTLATCILRLYVWHPTVLMCELPICLLGCRRFGLWRPHDWLPVCRILIELVAACPHGF